METIVKYIFLTPLILVEHQEVEMEPTERLICKTPRAVEVEWNLRVVVVELETEGTTAKFTSQEVQQILGDPMAMETIAGFIFLAKQVEAEASLMHCQ